MTWIVSKEEHGMTLLAFIQKKQEGLSSNKIKKAIQDKACLVNGRIECFSSYKLMESDVVSITIASLNEVTAPSVVFEDADFVIVNKPAGLVCEDRFFSKAFGEKASSWKLLHRLDKETSGLVMLGKTARAIKASRDLFSERKVQKFYLAIVLGKLKQEEGTIDNYLGVKGSYQGQTLYGKVEKNGLRAITSYCVLAQSKGFSLLLCDLKTGRTHQIRVHFSEKGHPLLGDVQYGDTKVHALYVPKRHMLHAWKLAFIHPFTHKKINFTLDPPSDFYEALKTFFPKETVDRIRDAT